ncbi:hypothetical protein [Vibrio celticus]|uniref:hypothetical protein n=1 Tax=Vibrio celticus TaxID=446372 RepID=UPI004069479A
MKNRSLVIVFIGIDGSGKSTAIERLQNKKKFKGFNFKTLTLGSGVSGSPWYRKLAFKIFGNKAKFNSHKKMRVSTGVVSPPLYYKLWILLNLYDKYRILKELTSGKKNKLYLVDRWLQNDLENYLDGPRTTNFDNTFTSRMVKKIEKYIFDEITAIDVDLMVYMKISAETSVARKPKDLTLEQATDAVKIIEKINYKVNKQVVIDSNKSILEVDKQMELLLLDLLSGEQQ